VHISAVEKAGLSTLNEGQTVEYEEVAKPRPRPRLNTSRFDACSAILKALGRDPWVKSSENILFKREPAHSARAAPLLPSLVLPRPCAWRSVFLDPLLDRHQVGQFPDSRAGTYTPTHSTTARALDPAPRCCAASCSTSALPR